MSKEQIVMDGVSAIQSGVAQVYGDELGKAYDGGFGEGVASVPPCEPGGDPSKIYSQEEYDAKLAADLAADALIDDEQIAAARAEVQVQVDLVTAALAEMTAKKEIAEGAVQGFKDKIDGLQSALDLLKSLITP